MTNLENNIIPSFKKSIQASIDLYREEKSSPRSVAIKLLNTKRYSKLFVKSLGIPVAETLGLHSHISDVDFASLPDNVVLKPQWGSSNNGVFLLQRIGEDMWRDDMRGIECTSDEIAAAYLDEHERYRSINLPVMLEERFVSAEPGYPVPLDYKGYCFGDKTMMLKQRDVNGGRDQSEWRFQYYDRDWTPHQQVRLSVFDNGGLTPPKDSKKIIETMDLIAKEIPLRFISVDMYNTKAGVGFGEFTVHPGAYQHYTEKWDQTFGKWYNHSDSPQENELEAFVERFRDCIANQS